MARLAPKTYRTYYHFRLSIAVAIARRQFCSSSACSKTSYLPFEFRSYMSWFQRYKYFRFWRPYCYFQLSAAVASNCRYFLQTLSGHKSQICRWKISSVFHSLRDYFRFQQSLPVAGHYWNRPRTPSLSSRRSKTPGSPLEFWRCLLYFRRFVNVRFATSGCLWMSIYLWTLFWASRGRKLCFYR